MPEGDDNRSAYVWYVRGWIRGKRYGCSTRMTQGLIEDMGLHAMEGLVRDSGIESITDTAGGRPDRVTVDGPYRHMLLERERQEHAGLAGA